MYDNQDAWLNPEQVSQETPAAQPDALDWNSGQDTVVEPEFTATESVEAVVEISQPVSEPVVESTNARKRRSGGGVVNILSWSDVGSIFDFSERYLGLEPETATLFCELFDVPQGSNVVDIAQALYPAGGEVAAFGIVTDIVSMVSKGVVGFTEGIRLVSRIDALPDLTIKTVARQISSVTGEEIRHRKNSQTSDFVSSIFEALDKSKESGRLTQLGIFRELLEVWPGNKR